MNLLGFSQPCMLMALRIILIIILITRGLKMPWNGSKIKSVLEPSDPNSQSLSKFPWHEVTSRITTPPLVDEMLVYHPGWSSHFPNNWSYPFIFLGGERHLQSIKVFFLRRHDHLTQSPEHWPLGQVLIWEWKSF